MPTSGDSRWMHRDSRCSCHYYDRCGTASTCKIYMDHVLQIVVRGIYDPLQFQSVLKCGPMHACNRN